jgi:glycerophosphoryl diester phosphodiesterase
MNAKAGQLLLIHHGARRGHSYPPNSLAALRACVEARALVVEVDITPLRDGDCALLHEGELERATDGEGPAFAATGDQIRSLHYLNGGEVTDEPIGLLSQAVATVRDHECPVELQLDLKPHAPLTDTVLQGLLSMIGPIRERVRVTSGADWALRRLRSLDAELALGFDPLLYLGVPDETVHDSRVPPFRIGAYGYPDDHPLSTRVWGAAANYLAARGEALSVLVPPGAVWYLNAELLCRSLDDGFDWISFLHSRGSEVDAWTLNAESPPELAMSRRLACAGVDRITTDDAPALAAVLRSTRDSRDKPDHRRIAY